jgi:uncharacterized protein (TIGR02391 family)
MDTEWAAQELRDFMDLCNYHRREWGRNGSEPALASCMQAIIALFPIVERIADRAWPEWRQHLPPRFDDGWEYDPLFRIASQTLALIQREHELESKLGEAGPSLTAASLHPDVWQAALRLWRTGHFGEAVLAAARSVNAALQAKTGRRDQGDAHLVADSFSLDPPTLTKPRLRLMKNDGSATYKSLQEGAIAFGRGCFMALRNVLAHEYGDMADPPEHLALEYLAAFSVLARWIESAEVERLT